MISTLTAIGAVGVAAWIGRGARVAHNHSVLASSHRDAALLPDVRQPRIVLGWPDRFFEPPQLERSQQLCHVECFAHGPRTVDVQHDLDVIPGLFARRTHTTDIDLVQLEMPKPAIQRPSDVFPDELRIGVTDQARIGG